MLGWALQSVTAAAAQGEKREGGVILLPLTGARCLHEACVFVCPREAVAVAGQAAPERSSDEGAMMQVF